MRNQRHPMSVKTSGRTGCPICGQARCFCKNGATGPTGATGPAGNPGPTGPGADCTVTIDNFQFINNPDTSVNQTTLQDLICLTVGASCGQFLIDSSFGVEILGVGGNGEIVLVIDGVIQGGVTIDGPRTLAEMTSHGGGAITRVANLAPGLHLICLRWRVTNAANTMRIGAVGHASLNIQEICCP